jgi:uncharacterized protein (UPF0335 family)
MQEKTLLAEEILDVIKRLEALEERAEDIKESKKAIFEGAESSGLDPKILRHIIKLRKMDPVDYQRQETLICLYKKATGLDITVTSA